MNDTSPLAVTLYRLDNQLTWYDAKSQHNQQLKNYSTVIQIVLAAAIPIAAWLTPNYVPAALGAIIAVLRGLESTYQWEYNWINYRSTAEKLKHEKFLFQARAGPYAGDGSAQRILAERVEGIVSREHASWITLRDERLRNSRHAATQTNE